MTALPEQVDRIAGRRAAPAAVLGGLLCDPNTGEALQPQRASAPDTIADAVATAWRIHAAGSWSSLPADERARWLDAIADELDRGSAAIAAADARTTGVVIAHTTLFAASLGATVRGVAERLRADGGDTDVGVDGRAVRLHRLPWGPAALLVPWNAPAAIAAGKVANALGAGCPVILKPTEWAPSSCNLLADAVEAAGLPAGVFQMVHGGAAQGAQLTADHRVRAVSFTGGVAAGRAIARQAAEDFKALQLELGGSNAAVVRGDADLDLTADALAAGCSKLNGQWCEAPRRVVVQRDVLADLADALVARLAGARVGSSLDPNSEIGPLAHESQRDRVAAQVERLAARGAEVRRTAPVPGDRGWFESPAIVLGAANDDCLDEIFGPVLTLHPHAGDADAVRLANAAPSGLAAYVFSRDVEAALALGARLHAGEVKVNGTSVLDLTPQSAQSFWGAAGIGGHGSREVFEFFRGSRIVGEDLIDPPL